MRRYKALLFLFSALLGCFLILLGTWFNTLNINSVKVKAPDSRLAEATLPWQFSEAGEAYIKFNSVQMPGNPTTWQIVIDDKIKLLLVNGKKVDLSNIPETQLNDYRNGFTIDLKNYLKLGKNRIHVKFENFGGPGKFNIEPHFSWLAKLILVAGFGCLAFAMQLFFKLEKKQFFILIFAIFLSVNYWSKTPWDKRTHDVAGKGGHYDYIQHIVNNKEIPPPNKGWTYFHPPLYYASAAFISAPAEALALDNTLLLQSFSIFCWIVFLMSAAATLKVSITHSPSSLMAGTALLMMWPSGIIHSVRLGNDVAFYAIYGIAFFATLLWWRSDQRKYLFISATFCLLGLLVKSNALIICACLGLCIAFRFFQAPGGHARIRKINDAVIAICFFIIGLVASFATRIYFYQQGKLDSWLVSNSGALTHQLAVPNDLKSYIPMDISTFLYHPYTSPWDDSLGRLNFWNYFFSSSLTGEFTFKDAVASGFAIALGVLLLTLLLLAFYRLVCLRWFNLEHQKSAFPFAITLFLFISGLMYLRFSAPFACSGDFRYVLPVLTAFVYFTCQFGGFTRVIHYLFAICSALFIVNI